MASTLEYAALVVGCFAQMTRFPPSPAELAKRDPWKRHGCRGNSHMAPPKRNRTKGTRYYGTSAKQAKK